MARQTRDTRTNEEWIAALGGDTGYRDREAAYKDLANYLYVVTYNYLYSRSAGVPGLRSKSHDQLAALAEDFMQSTLLKIIEGQLYNTFQGERRFLSYMAAVAINQVRQRLRLKEWWVYSKPLPSSRPSYDPESGRGLPPLEPELIADAKPDTRPQLKEMWEAIRQCVRHLPERWRRAFVLKVFKDLSAEEIKDHVGAPSRQAVYNLVNRARGRLKECLADSGWNVDDIWTLLD